MAVQPLRAMQQDSVCNGAVLHETVAEPTSRVPLPGASISATWQYGSVRVTADSLGQATICAPPDRVITLRASYRNLSASPQSALLTTTRATTQVLSINVPVVLVRGTVLDDATGSPLPNASLRVANTPLATLTDGSGHFFFQRLPIGDYTLHVESISYTSYIALLAVRGEDLDVTVRLAPHAIALQPLNVVAFSQRLERAGFYERRKRGIGTFLAARELEKMKGQFGSDLLRNVPSMLQVPQASRRDAPRNRTIGRGNCRYRFVIDGTRTLADFEMDNIPPYTVEGLEIYSGLSEIPTIFRGAVDAGAGTCGLIAVWTKDGR